MPDASLTRGWRHKNKNYNIQMSDTQRQKNSELRFRTRKPNKWNVIMLNDDETTMDFVVDVLCDIFRKSEADAERIMMKIHMEGAAVVGTYYLDIAESKKRKTIALAREEGFPLELTLEEQ